MAKIYLGATDTGFNIVNNGSEVFGTTGNQSINIAAGLTGVTMDSSVEGATFAGALADYTFKQVGVSLEVYKGGVLVTTFDSPNQTPTFSDGEQDIGYASGIMTIGGTTLVDGAAAVPATGGTGGGTGTGGNPGATYVLTTAADPLNGTSNDDTFVATNTTLTAGDDLNGGAGNDTLNYSASALSAVLNHGAFTMDSVETLSAVNDSGFLVSFDLSGTTGLQTVQADNSTSSTAFNYIQSLDTTDAIDVSINNVTNVAANVSAYYAASVVTGTSDKVNLNIGTSTVGTVTIGEISNGGVATATGIETIAIATSGQASTITTLASAISTLEVTGAQALTITAALDSAVTAIEAGTMTGALTLTTGVAATALTVNTGSANDNINAAANSGVVTANLGDGDDTIALGSNYLATDTVAAGEGADTVSATDISKVKNALATATGETFANTTSVETLAFTAAESGTDTLDAAAYDAATNTDGTKAATAGVLTYDFTDSLSSAAASTTSILNMNDNSTVKVNDKAASTGTATVNENLTVTNAVDGTADTFSLEVTTDTADAGMGTLSAVDAETLNITVNDTNTTATDVTGTLVDVFTVGALALTDTTTLNVAGSGSLTVTAPVTTGAITTVEAATMTGNLVIALDDATDVSTATAQNVTVNSGTGADAISIGGANNFGAYTVNSGNGDDNILLISAATAEVTHTVVAGDATVETTEVNSGNITIVGAKTTANVTAGTGSWTVTTDAGNDTITTGSGNDTILAGAGNDTVVTGAGNDTITAGRGVDNLNGGAGNDTFNFTYGTTPLTEGITSADTVTGGDGTDTVVITATATLNDAIYNNWSGVENLTTSNGANNVTVNSIGQAAGLQKITTGTGADTINVGEGFTNGLTLDLSNDGNDLVNASLAVGDMTIAADQLTDITSADTITGGTSTNDTLQLTADNSIVGAHTDGMTAVENIVVKANATTASDNARVVLGADSVIAAGKTLTVDATDLTDSNADFNFDGTAIAAPALVANIKNINISTGAGDDLILAGGGNDVINTGSGNDIIVGGLGVDVITGGAGTDQFWINNLLESSANNADTITDFDDSVTGDADVVKIDNTVTVANTGSNFAGNYATFSEAQGAVTDSDGIIDYVFQTDTNTLWVDVNDDGTLNANDVQVVLTNVSEITAAAVQITDLAPAPLTSIFLTETNGDGIINIAERAVPSVVISGVTDELAGNVVLTNANGLNQTVVADAVTGAWSYSLTTAQIDAMGQGTATDNITASVSNSAGDIGTNAVAVNIDTVIAAPVIALLNDTGASAADLITQNASLTAGTEAGATVEYSLDSGTTWLNLAAYTAATAADAAYTVDVRQTDLAANVSSSSTISFTKDTTVVAPLNLDLDTGTDTGTFDTDDITNDNTPTIRAAAGSVEAGATVSLTDNLTTATALITAEADGSWVYTTTALADGVHNYTATQTDIAGNTSVASAVLNVTIDTTAPAAPTFALHTDTANNAANAVPATLIPGTSTDGITSDTTVDITGLVEATATWQYSVNGGASWSAAQAPATTSFELAQNTTYVIGQVLVRQTDLAGNTTGTPSSNAAVIVTDNIAPTGTTIISITNDSGATFGNGTAVDEVTNDNTLTVTGAGTTGDTVQLYIDGVATGVSALVAAGAWSVDYTGTAIADGNYSFTAVETDVAGNVGAATAIALPVTVDTTAPTLGSLSLDLATANDSGTSNTDNNTNVNASTIRATFGTATDIVAGVTVLRISGASANVDTTITQAMIDAGFVDVNVALTTDTTNILQANLEDLAGNQSGTGANLAITEDSTPPVPVTSSLAYDASTDVLTITGSGFKDGVTATLDNIIDMTKVTWDVNSDGASTLDYTFDASSTVTINSDTQITVALTSTEANTLETMVGFAGSAEDNVNIAAGFLVDDAGNASTAGAATNLSTALTLVGTDNADNMFGGSLNDSLSGGLFGDTLTGNAGRDTLTGGAGSDTFVYASATDGVDTYTDFDWGDAIDVLDLTIANLSDINLVAATSDNNVSTAINTATGIVVNTLAADTKATAADITIINGGGDLVQVATNDTIANIESAIVAQLSDGANDFSGNMAEANDGTLLLIANDADANGTADSYFFASVISSNAGGVTEAGEVTLLGIFDGVDAANAVAADFV